MDGVDGFRIAGKLHPWGTRFADIVPGEHDQGYSSRELPCAEALGFPTVYAEVTAPRPDRPVMTVAYELSTALTPREAFIGLVKALGQPDSIDREGEADGAGISSWVVLYAQWHRGAVGYSVSLYGAPRDSDYGPGIGKLYLTWRETEKAARPYADARKAANEAVARAADATEGTPEIFVVGWDLFDEDYKAPSDDQRALDAPELLTTPAPIASRLGKLKFALWRGNGAWYLSTARETVLLGLPPHDKATVLEIEPARGGGYAAIWVGSWRVRDSYGSREIARAAEALGQVPGLAIERVKDHDV